MLFVIWFILVGIALLCGAYNHTLDAVLMAVPHYALVCVQLAFSLFLFMGFWLGLLNLAEAAGLIKKLSKRLQPLMGYLFPDIPSDHPAIHAIVLNMSANMLGIANAATPLGLKAMRELSRLNNHSSRASDAMCMFLAINTSSIQLIPASAIAFLIATGATDPYSVIVSAFFATCCSTIVAIFLAKKCARFDYFFKRSQT